MQSEYKIKPFPGNRFDMVGVSKKNCSDMITSSNKFTLFSIPNIHFYLAKVS